MDHQSLTGNVSASAAAAIAVLALLAAPAGEIDREALQERNPTADTTMGTRASSVAPIRQERTTDTDGAATDAEMYASHYQVSQTESEARLRMMDEYGPLFGDWQELAGDSFAGVYFEHTPDFGVVIRITSDEDLRPESLIEALEASSAPYRVEYGAPHSLAELQTAQMKVDWTSIYPELQGTSVDVIDGELELDVLSEGRDQESKLGDLLAQAEHLRPTQAIGMNASLDNIGDIPVTVKSSDVPIEAANRGGGDI